MEILWSRYKGQHKQAAHATITKTINGCTRTHAHSIVGLSPVALHEAAYTWLFFHFFFF